MVFLLTQKRDLLLDLRNVNFLENWIFDLMIANTDQLVSGICGQQVHISFMRGWEGRDWDV